MNLVGCTKCGATDGEVVRMIRSPFGSMPIRSMPFRRRYNQSLGVAQTICSRCGYAWPEEPQTPMCDTSEQRERRIAILRGTPCVVMP